MESWISCLSLGVGVGREEVVLLFILFCTYASLTSHVSPSFAYQIKKGKEKKCVCAVVANIFLFTFLRSRCGIEIMWLEGGVHNCVCTYNRGLLH